MAENLWPITKFHFTVEGANFTTGFQEVSGLEISYDPIDYRSGDDPTYSMQKIPGLKKFTSITLKKGVFQDDDAFYEWIKDTLANPDRRETLTINLLDEEGTPVKTWTVVNAFPVKYQGPDLNATDNNVAVETLELAHEGIEM
ncbi:hypothetical protein GCM10009122_53700 [Fulvivirga kasyanovii]|uniref:Phage tail protein n=2 Tax=Fulvivirga TaxID=396811 RepID=A0A937FVM5_9BACT|nr:MULTISPECIES: phage tail protein [Fulvivirga]MBL6445828.1 phage tail protein [Fulvivirga marina]MTI27700.1 phage tail protein [Fulvivirga kasyanovii]UII30608.1 phage tail protein [Fulvivirga ulvae]